MKHRNIITESLDAKLADQDKRTFEDMLADPKAVRVDVLLEMLDEAWRISRDGIDEIAGRMDFP